MKRPRWSRALSGLGWTCLVITAALASACASSQVKDYRLEDAAGAKGYRIVDRNGLQVAVQFLDREGMRDYFRRNDAMGLFSVVNTVPLNVFLVRLKNTGADHAAFDPRMSLLADGNKTRLTPYTFIDLYMSLRGVGGNDRMLKKLRELIWEKSVSIKRSQVMERLLLFSGTESIGSEVKLFVGEIYVNGRAVDMSFDFKAVGVTE